MQINTRYQLFAAKGDTPEALKAARTLLTIPDLFHYCRAHDFRQVTIRYEQRPNRKSPSESFHREHVECGPFGKSSWVYVPQCKTSASIASISIYV